MIEHAFGGDWTEDKLARLAKYLTAYRSVFTGNAKARHFTTGTWTPSPERDHDHQPIHQRFKLPQTMFMTMRRARATATVVRRSHWGLAAPSIVICSLRSQSGGLASFATKFSKSFRVCQHGANSSRVMPIQFCVRGVRNATGKKSARSSSWTLTECRSNGAPSRLWARQRP